MSSAGSARGSARENWETSAWCRKTLAPRGAGRCGTTRPRPAVWRANHAAQSAFTVLASLSLALGIGANTAIYSFMDALLMRSLPVADPESLVVLKWHITAKRTRTIPWCMTPAATSMMIRKRERRRRSSRSPPLSVLRKSGSALSRSVRVPSGRKAERDGGATGRDHRRRVRFRRTISQGSGSSPPQAA